MGTKASAERKMRNPAPLNLVQFRRKIKGGDLILIGSRKVIESDISIPPQLLHSINFTIREKFSISRDIKLPVWDSAGIVVDMSISPNSGKCILELTPEGFVVSEFISRMAEIKKKNYDICVRFLEGPTNQAFREQLLTYSEYLAGKSLDELVGTAIYQEVRRETDDYLDDTNRDSTLINQLKEAFYMIVSNSEDLTISKPELHDLMREFTGTNMDLTVEELAEQLGIDENITFQEFYKKWAEGPGRLVLSDEIYQNALLAGQFIKYSYKTLSVIEEESKMISTPDDFATNYEDISQPRSKNIKLLPGFSFSVQTQVKL